MANEAEQHAQRRRLARPVGTEKAVDLALPDSQVQAIHGYNLLPVAFAEIGSFYHNWFH